MIFRPSAETKEEEGSMGKGLGWLMFLCLMLVRIPVSSTCVHAEILLAYPTKPGAPQLEEDFPQSRFGSGPMRSDKTDEVLNDPSNRKPAGLEFTNDLNSSGQAQPSAVIPELGTPDSMANRNPMPASQSRAGVQEVALIASDLGFFPRTIFITRDIPVRLFVTGSSKKSLCIMMDFFQIRRQVRSQKIEEITFTPPAAGQFRFYCPINGMEGTLLVKEIGAPSSAGMGHLSAISK